MRFLWCLFSLGLLAVPTWAQFDVGIVTLLLELPPCVQQCALQTLSRINCPLTNVASCVCGDPELQKEVAICIIGKCNATEQYIATKFTQEKVCYGTDKPSRQHTLIFVNILLSVIAYPAFVLRFVARYQVLRPMWWDDWCVIAAMCCMIPISAISIFQAKMGFGLHFWDVPADNIVLLRKLYYVVQVLYCLVLAFAKLSIVLLYFQLFPRRKFRVAIYVTIGLIAAKALVFVPLVLFQCSPVRSIWTQEPSKCINEQMLVYWGAGISIFEDLVIMSLPVFELRHLKVSIQTRVGLCLLFALGSCACVTSIVRLKYTLAFGNSVDVTWDNLDVYAWSVIELFTAIICSCLLCYRPLVIKMLPKWLHGGSSLFRLRSSEKSSSIKLKKSYRSSQSTERIVTSDSFNPMPVAVPLPVTVPIPESVITDCHQNDRARARISDLESNLSDIRESQEDAREVTEKEDS